MGRFRFSYQTMNDNGSLPFMERSAASGAGPRATGWLAERYANYLFVGQQTLLDKPVAVRAARVGDELAGDQAVGELGFALERHAVFLEHVQGVQRALVEGLGFVGAAYERNVRDHAAIPAQRCSAVFGECFGGLLAAGQGRKRLKQVVGVNGLVVADGFPQLRAGLIQGQRFG